MTFEYDAGASYLLTAIRFTHTAVPSVLSRPTFWLFLVLHLAVFWAYGKGYLEAADVEDSPLSISWKIVQVITGMTTFFEVFYTNHIFGRYLRLYTITKSILGQIPSFAFDMRVHAGDAEPEMVRLATRYYIAGTLLFFFELESHVSEKEWSMLERANIIDAEERATLEPYPAYQRSMVVLHWAGRVAKETILIAKAPNNVMKGMIDRMVALREAQQSILDILKLPMPFQYFHLLNMMVVVNLGMWAYGMGVTNSVFAPVGFFFAELIFCGMMELAGQMSDPFGQDEVDFPLRDWLDVATWNAATILEYKYTIGRNGWKEVALRGKPLNFIVPRTDRNCIDSMDEGLTEPKDSMDGGLWKEHEEGIAGHMGRASSHFSRLPQEKEEAAASRGANRAGDCIVSLGEREHGRYKPLVAEVEVVELSNRDKNGGRSSPLARCLDAGSDEQGSTTGSSGIGRVRRKLSSAPSRTMRRWW